MFKILFYLLVIGVIVIGFLYYREVEIVQKYVDETIAVSEEIVTQLKGHKSNAIRQARRLLDQKLKSGYDLVNRPCLAEEIVSGWAIDIVSQPITDKDRMKENQCQLYLEGKVKNLIIMDEYGHIITNGPRIGL